MPVVSQSIMKPMVPVGASTVTCEFLKPNFSPRLQRVVPRILRRHEQFRLHVFRLDAAHGVAVHADHVEHRLAVDCVARERAHAFGDARRLRVRFAAHQRGDGAGHVAAFVGVVGQRHGHEQRAEIGVAQAERPEIVRIFGDFRRRIAGVVDQNFLRRDGHVHGVPERRQRQTGRWARETSSG